jgi:hypothetical protein
VFDGRQRQVVVLYWERIVVEVRGVYTENRTDRRWKQLTRMYDPLDLQNIGHVKKIGGILYDE